LLARGAALMLGNGFQSIGPLLSRSGRPDWVSGRANSRGGVSLAGPKAAAFAVFVRIFATAFEPIGKRWEPLVWGAALLSMCIGNFAALLQGNIKRKLGLQARSRMPVMMLVGASRRAAKTAPPRSCFILLRTLHEPGRFRRRELPRRKRRALCERRRFKGLGRKQPFAAAMLTIFMLRW